VVVSSSYLEGLKKTVSGESSSPSAASTAEDAMAASLRKTRIQSLDRERQQRDAARVAALGTNFNPLDPSLDDILKTNTRSTSFAQSKAAEVATAETDEIKFIKSKVRVALSQAERERQIALKARIKAGEEAEEARIAAQMEADRQAAIARTQAEQRAAHERRMEFADVMKSQLRERAQKREDDKELTYLEGEQMKRAIVLQAEKEKEKAAAVVARQKAMAAEQVKAFEKAAALRARLAEEEAREEERLAAYAREQARKERVRLEAEEKEKAEKARIFAEMLAKQERVMDTRGEEDERRAKRHQEERILAERRREAEKVAAVQANILKCDAARRQQLVIKAELEAREAEEDRRMVAAAAARDAEAVAAARRAQEEARLLRERNREGVLKQIADKEEAAERDRAGKYRERQALLLAEASRARKIAAMRDEITGDLLARGLSEDLIYKAKI